MPESIQAVRGMNDVLPQQSAAWQHLEQLIAGVVQGYGYQEIRMPLLESTHLFNRTIGDTSDIVEKEMYTFSDLNGDSVTLRPEGTASCVRACLEHGLLYNQQQKLWYSGPMFRHEKPQKGRYRQFHQVGVEAFGISGIGIELEMIALCRRLWHALGVSEGVTLQINTLGSVSDRQRHREQLVSYLTPHRDQLDEDSKRRLDKNPLRIMDSKNSTLHELVAKAPHLHEVLCQESKDRFEALCEGLQTLGISYTVNPRLVRGLDYYGDLVFEWTTNHLGAQATVCAGGRFDRLVEQLGGKPTEAVGFAMGIERLLLLREAVGVTSQPLEDPLVYFVAIGDIALQRALVLAEALRDSLPAAYLLVHVGGGNFKRQFKMAAQSGARFACVLGEDEIVNQTISIKDLRESKEQVTILQSELNGQFFKV